MRNKITAFFLCFFAVLITTSVIAQPEIPVTIEDTAPSSVKTGWFYTINPVLPDEQIVVQIYPGVSILNPTPVNVDLYFSDGTMYHYSTNYNQQTGFYQTNNSSPVQFQFNRLNDHVQLCSNIQGVNGLMNRCQFENVFVETFPNLSGQLYWPYFATYPEGTNTVYNTLWGEKIFGNLFR